MNSEPPPAGAVPAYSSSDRLWSIFCHLSYFVGFGLISFIFPLAVYLALRHESPYVAHHSREALNFHLSLLLYTILSVPLCMIAIGFGLIGLIALFGIICSIMAAVHSSNGVFYRYPLTIRFVK